MWHYMLVLRAAKDGYKMRHNPCSDLHSLGYQEVALIGSATDQIEMLGITACPCQHRFSGL